MHRVIASLLCGPVLLACSAFGQEGSGSESAPAALETTPGAVREASTVLHLKDKDGNLVPNPQLMTVEQLDELLQRQPAPSERQPAYTIQSLEAVGDASGDHAKLSLSVVVIAHEDRLVRVPLRLGEAILRKGATITGSGEFLFSHDAQANGYVAWLRAEANVSRTLSFDVLVPLTHVAGKTRLRLSAPVATRSELKLTVPATGVVGTVAGKALLSSTTEPNGTTTELTIAGLDPGFQLSWTKAATRPDPSPAVLESFGQILVRLEDRSARTEATLTVMSLDGPLERFTVRLPTGAELVPDPSTLGYTIQAGEEPGTVEVRLSERISEPVEIKLTTRQMQRAEGGWFDLAGFEVVQAVRQWGDIGVLPAGDWHVLWGPRRGLRQVERVADAFASANPTATFEYFTQPCSLSARVVAPKSRVEVEPEYLLQVGSDQIRLDARLKYRIRGAEQYALEVDLPGWQLDEIGPETIIAQAGVEVDPEGVVSIPLLEPTIGTVEISLSAHAPVDATTGRLDIELPRPRADLVRPAAVAVLPADDVELTPDAEALVGLVRQQIPPPMKLPPLRQQPPLFYRGDNTHARFAAGIEVHDQSIRVEVTSRIDLGAETPEVLQELKFSIGHVPAETLDIEIPRTLLGTGAIEVRLGDERLVPTEPPRPSPAGSPSESADASAEGSSEETSPDAPVRRRVTLPPPGIGPYVLEIRFPIERRPLQPETSVPVIVPLVMPADGELLANRLIVTTPEGASVHAGGGSWTSVPSVAAARPMLPMHEFVASDRVSRCVLGIWLENPDARRSLVVERAWVQTWQDADVRQDRAVFRFHGDRKQLDLILPAGTAWDEVTLSLDGKVPEARAVAPGRLTVSLPGDPTAGRHWLEVVYQLPDHALSSGSVEFELPRLEADARVRRLYWQLVLPRDMHLVVPPDGMTAEYRWQFNRGFLGREPLLDEAGLLGWRGSYRGIEASATTEPSAATHRYLFSSLGSVSRCRARIMPRSWIVGCASAVVLLFGLTLMHLPRSRRMVVLFLGALAVISVGFLYPEAVVLGLQAGFLGVALVGLAAWLANIVSRRHGSRLPEGGSSLFSREIPATVESPQEEALAPSTETAPTAMQADMDQSP